MSDMNRKKAARLIITLGIVLAVAGIWILKNTKEAKDVPESGSADIQNADFFLEAEGMDLETLKSYVLPIIMDFGTETCGPCVAMAPDLASINEEMQGRAIIKHIDLDKYPEAAYDLPIRLTPTQMFINSDGTPYVPGDELNIAFTMYKLKDSGEHALTVHEGGLTADQMRLILSDMGVTE